MDLAERYHGTLTTTARLFVFNFGITTTSQVKKKGTVTTKGSTSGNWVGAYDEGVGGDTKRRIFGDLSVGPFHTSLVGRTCPHRLQKTLVGALAVWHAVT